MTAPTLPAAITEAISAIRCDARFGDTVRALESTLAPWLAIVREVAEGGWYAHDFDDEPKCFYCRAWCEYGAETCKHADSCLWLRATQLVAGRGTG